MEVKVEANEVQPLIVSLLEYRWDGNEQMNVMEYLEWEGIVQVLRDEGTLFGLKGQMV